MNCCKDVYKNCYTKEKAFSDINNRVQDLVDRQFLLGASVGIICDGEIVYQNGFGQRNEAGDPFTEETHGQMESATFLLLVTYLANLANQQELCAEDLMLSTNRESDRIGDKLAYQINNNRASEISGSVSDLIAGGLGYTFNNTKLSWLLCHDPRKVKELLACRIFTKDFDNNLKRNKVLKFFGANNYLAQDFLNRLNTVINEKTGDVNELFQKIRDYLEAEGFSNFGFGTANYAAEPNHADGAIWRGKCWEEISLVENVDDYEASVGGYINTPGILELLKLLINNGRKDDVEILKQNSLRQWFRKTKTRVEAFDQYCDTSLFDIPEIHVKNSGMFNLAIAGGNLQFYSGLTSPGVRTLMAYDKDNKFGVSIIARGKTVFPEALMGYVFSTVVNRDPCQADQLFNFLYRLFNPFLQLQLPNIPVGIPCPKEFQRFRLKGTPIDVDGLVFDSCEGALEFKKEGDCKLTARFGNCPDFIELKPLGLDNYGYCWKDRSGLEYPGQLQINFNYNQSKVKVVSGMYRKDNINFKELEINPNTDPCGTECEPLPPLEDKHKCDCKPCGPYGPYTNDEDYAEEEEEPSYLAYCRPICYKIPEEEDCLFCKKKPVYYKPCEPCDPCDPYCNPFYIPNGPYGCY